MKKIVIGLIAAFFFIGIYFYVTGQRASVLEKELATDIFHEIPQKPLEDILHQDMTQESVDEVWLRISELCDYGYDLDQLNEYQKNFWLISYFIGETGNGGVEQFLYNCHDQVDITLQTLQNVHLENSTRYLAESKEICSEKIEMYSNDEITEKLNQKDDTYYDESEKECNAFLLQYLKENKEHFMKES